MSLALLQHSQLGLVQHQSRTRSHVAVRATAAPAGAMDKLMGATRMSVLEHADEELQNLCSSKATPEERAQCWEVRCGAVCWLVGPNVQICSPSCLELVSGPHVGRLGCRWCDWASKSISGPFACLAEPRCHMLTWQGQHSAWQLLPRMPPAAQQGASTN